MSNPPISFRFPFATQVASLPPEVQMVHRTTWNSITDLNGAIAALKTQITSLTPTTSTSSTAGTENVTQNITTINNTVSGGPVNNQSGVTAYTTAQSDNGALIILADASPVAVTLNNSVTLPYWVFVLNQGTGVVTLTPQQNTINGSASEMLTENVFALVFFDGTNFWSCTTSIVPQSFVAVTHEWINSYSSTTGLFTATRPDYTDLTGLPVLPSSAPATASNWVNSYTASTGVFTETQPTSADVIPASGVTGSRPTIHAIGQPYFDTSLGIPIWWSGANWVNASGATV